MCGILVSKNTISEKLFIKSLKLLSHRGPDNLSYIFDEGFYWGHVRLSLFDLSDASNQPIKLLNGGTLVYNGEIFNFKDFGDFPSDTLMLVNFFNTWDGLLPSLFSFLNNLNGFFSIVFEYANKIYSIRDRYGEKPLYLFKDNKNVIYSSEIKSIVSLSSASIDDKVLKRLANDPFDFSNSKINDALYDTCYRNIFEQKPGFIVVYCKEESNLMSYEWYNLDADIMIYKSSDTESLLINSVDLRLQSDAKGAFSLSGGVDSSLLCSISKNVLKKRTNTFSIVSASSIYSEIDVLNKNSDLLSDETLKIFEKDFISSLNSDDIFNKLNHFGYPYFDANIVQYLLYGKVKDFNYKFIIDGHGADELFSGYQWHIPALIYSELSNFNIKNAFILVKLYFKSFPTNYSFAYKIYTIIRGLFRYLVQKKKKYFFKSRSNANNFVRYNEMFNRVLLRLLNNYDMTSMYNSIETRAPFLDHRLVANVLSKESNFFVGLSNKIFLRKLLKKYSNLEVPTVKIGLRSFIWDFISHETRSELFSAYNKVAAEFYENKTLCEQDFIKLLSSPSGEILFWKHISVYSLKYFK